MNNRLRTPLALIVTACFIEILSMLSLSTFPSMIHVFQDSWHISNAEAGTISGLFFAGELIGVAFLSAITDKLNAKPIFIISLLIGFFAGILFAFTAQDFYTAAFWRFLQGLALGGTYMPGLKILTDHLPEKYRSRGTSFYTATFYLAAGLSYFLTLKLEPMIGWQWTFVIAAIGPLIAAIISLVAIPSSPPPKVKKKNHVFDFNPVLKNRRVIGFSIIYGLHNMELVAFSSWLIPFFIFNKTLQSPEAVGIDWSLGTIAAFISIAALPASVFINEVAQRKGRQFIITVFMIISAITGILFGAISTAPFLIVICVAFIFSMTIASDSSAISSGLIYVAEPKYKGITISFYSVIGFLGAAVGPIIFGLVLDQSGGEKNPLAWAWAFGSIASLTLLGPIVIKYLIGSSPIDVN